jgi:dual specificity phosphatase 12
MGRILPSGLFLGDAKSCTEQNLEANNIQAIVRLANGPAVPDGIHLCRIYIEDCCDEDIAQYFDGANQFIRYHLDKGHNVLVHCTEGVSRSATIVISFIRNLHRHWTAEEAIEFVRQAAPHINPNPGFLKQLE